MLGCQAAAVQDALLQHMRVAIGRQLDEDAEAKASRKRGRAASGPAPAAAAAARRQQQQQQQNAGPDVAAGDDWEDGQQGEQGEEGQQEAWGEDCGEGQYEQYEQYGGGEEEQEETEAVGGEGLDGDVGNCQPIGSQVQEGGEEAEADEGGGEASQPLCCSRGSQQEAAQAAHTLSPAALRRAPALPLRRQPPLQRASERARPVTVGAAATVAAAALPRSRDALSIVGAMYGVKPLRVSVLEGDADDGGAARDDDGDDDDGWMF